LRQRGGEHDPRRRVSFDLAKLTLAMNGWLRYNVRCER